MPTVDMICPRMSAKALARQVGWVAYLGVRGSFMEGMGLTVRKVGHDLFPGARVYDHVFPWAAACALRNTVALPTSAVRLYKSAPGFAATGCMIRWQTIF